MVMLLVQFILSIFDRNIDFFLFSEKSLFVRLYKRQISDLAVSINVYFQEDNDLRLSQIYVGILSWFSNVQYLTLNGLRTIGYSGRILHNLSFDRCCSSLITRLHIRIFSFHDCLCLMDGRFSKLTTLTLDVDYIRYWTLDNNNQVKHLGGTIDNRYFDCYF